MKFSTISPSLLPFMHPSCSSSKQSAISTSVFMDTYPRKVQIVTESAYAGILQDVEGKLCFLYLFFVLPALCGQSGFMCVIFVTETEVIFTRTSGHILCFDFFLNWLYLLELVLEKKEFPVDILYIDFKYLKIFQKLTIFL